jgi:Uma2 family endonuclease
MTRSGDPAVPEMPIFRLTVEQYHEIVRAGILTEDDPVELLEGWLVCKMSKNPPHAVSNDLTANALREKAPPGWSVRSQDPITTNDSEPEPDLALVRGSARDYAHRHPEPQDIALVVEIADSSLDQDRKTKLRIYARAAIPTYWIVNLLQQRVEVYTSPQPARPNPSYDEHRDFTVGEFIPLIVDSREVAQIPVASILP